MEKNMNVNEDDIDDDFFEEYGEEMTQAFLSFCNHFREYACEMNKELCKECMLKAHEFADDYKINIREENGDYLYSSTDTDDTHFAYGIIQLQLKFTEFVKEKDRELWEKAVQYAADYGGVGRVQFFHSKDKDNKDGKDTGS